MFGVTRRALLRALGIMLVLAACYCPWLLLTAHYELRGENAPRDLAGRMAQRWKMLSVDRSCTGVVRIGDDL